MTVAQINSASQAHPDAPYVVDGHDLVNVSPVYFLRRQTRVAYTRRNRNLSISQSSNETLTGSLHNRCTDLYRCVCEVRDPVKVVYRLLDRRWNWSARSSSCKSARTDAGSTGQIECRKWLSPEEVETEEDTG